MNLEEKNKQIDTLLKLQQLQNFDKNSLDEFNKTMLYANFIDVKSKNPKLTKDQIAKSIGSSASTISRVMKDLEVTSPYRYKIPLKSRTKKTNSNNKYPNETDTITEKVTQNENIKTRRKNKDFQSSQRMLNKNSNYVLGGGININNENDDEVDRQSGAELINDAFN